MSWGDELFELCEEEQGFAFVSDGISDYSEIAVLSHAKRTLRLQVKLNRKLERWIAEKELQLKNRAGGRRPRLLMDVKEEV